MRIQISAFIESDCALLQTDEAMLTASNSQLSLNKKHAVIVRLGEKRILNAILERLQNLLRLERGKGNVLKRRGGGGDEAEKGPRTKKSRR